MHLICILQLSAVSALLLPERQPTAVKCGAKECCHQYKTLYGCWLAPCIFQLYPVFPFPVGDAKQKKNTAFRIFRTKLDYCNGILNINIRPVAKEWVGAAVKSLKKG